MPTTIPEKVTPPRQRQRKSALHQCRQECQARRQPPTAKNIAIHRLVTEEHLTQRAVAKKFGISQKRVHDIVHYVTRWQAEHSPLSKTPTPTGNPDPSPPPAPPLTLRDFLRQDLAEIEAQIQGVHKKIALAEEKYEASVVTLRKGDEAVWTRTTTRQDPPRVGWESLLARLRRDRAKVQRALLEAESQQEPGEGEGGSGREGDAVAPPPPHSPSPTHLPFPAYPLSEESGRACACTAKGRGCPCVKSVEKELCCDCRKIVGLMRPAEGVRHWSYQALGVRQELQDLDRNQFVTLVTGIDDLADDANAMARAELSLRETTSPPHPLTPSPTPKAEGESASLPALRREYFERLLDLDFNYAPRQRQSVLDRYDAATGQVNWWLPGRIFRHEENLRWIHHPDEQDDDEDPQNSDSDSKPAPAPLPPPAKFTPEQLDSWIQHLGPQRVVQVRLSNVVNIGRRLTDMCIEQESVVIYEQIVDHVKGEAGESPNQSPPSPAENDGGAGEGEGGRAGDCRAISVLGSPPLDPPARLTLTPALRDALYEQVGQEGVAVLALDGRIYFGPSLGKCGLPHRGVLVLRELCHSTPPWGESPWRNFKPNKRVQSPAG